MFVFPILIVIFAIDELNKMLKLIKNVRTERLDNLIKCPNCNRTLGGINHIEGQAKITVLCKKCGQVSVEIEDYTGI